MLIYKPIVYSNKPLCIKSKLSYTQWHINLRMHLLSLHSVVSAGLGC